VVVLLRGRGHDAGEAHAVAAHQVGRGRAVLLRERGPERARVARPELVGVPDDDGAPDAKPAAVARARIALGDAGHVLPAGDAEVAVDVRAGDVRVELVRPGDPVLARADRRVGDDAHVGAQALRADEALHQPARGEVLVIEQPDRRGPERAADLPLVDLAVAGEQDDDGLARL